MNARTVLVTGAAGFLGSHLTDALLASGHCVIGVDNLSHGLLENLEQARRHPDFEFRRLDILDIEALRAAAAGVDAIVHMAAFKIPRYGNRIDTLLINSQGTHNALQVAVENGAKFVFSSTSDVYGQNSQIPFSEDHTCVIGSSTVPRWAYAISKLYDEHLAFAFSEKYGIPVSIVRIFGSYGPRQNLSWWGGPQSVFIEAMFRGEVIPLHGDGQQTRSFTYVSDTVAGILAMVDSDAANGEIFNIGSTHEIAIFDLARLIHQLTATGRELQLRYIPYNELNAGAKYEDVRRRVPDISKAQRLLGFQPQVGLEEGLKRTIEWQRVARTEAARAAAVTV
jgi:UDP-glucose 4-epimerase